MACGLLSLMSFLRLITLLEFQGFFESKVKEPYLVILTAHIFPLASVINTAITFIIKVLPI